MKMKLSPEAMNNAVSGVGSMIGKIPAKTQQTIRSLFFLTVFSLTVGGIVMGVMWGKEAAKIKSAPIIEHTNDAFELDMKRERTEGNFSVLDTEMINEMKKMDIGKIQFPTRTSMEPEVDRGIIEAESGRKAKETPEVRPQDPLFEGDYRKKPSIESDVKSIEKRSGATLEERDSIIDREKKEIAPIPERELGGRPEPLRRGPGVRRLEKRTAPVIEDHELESGSAEKEVLPSRERNSAPAADIRKREKDVPPLQKKRATRGSDIRLPEPQHRNEGIIGE